MFHGIIIFQVDAHLLSHFAGQFLLEEARLIEAAEMAKKAAELDSTEFDVVFNAAHMLRFVFAIAPSKNNFVALGKQVITLTTQLYHLIPPS